MGTSKRYNSVPVKDNCALFAPTSPFLWPKLSDGLILIFPLPTAFAMATNFENFGTINTTTTTAAAAAAAAITTIIYHRLRGSASPVVKVTSHFNGKLKI